LHGCEPTAIDGCVDDELGDCAMPALPATSTPPDSAKVPSSLETTVISPAVRTTDHRGRHTTTSSELHPLPGGGVLIDTPGLREVGLWTDESSVDSTFPEIEELAEACRFRDCSHTAEPGCVVREAVADGRLSEGRYEAWSPSRTHCATKGFGSQIG
jgi:ribosome biogenesis GTPase